MDNKIHVGYYNLQDKKVFTKHFSYARWYENIEVEPQQIPVYGEFKYHECSPEDKGKKLKDFPGITFSVEGTIVGSDFTSCFCGNPIGKGKIDEEVGKKSRYHQQAYCHAVASNILEGKGNIELLPEFEARRIDFIYDGKPNHTYGIFLK